MTNINITALRKDIFNYMEQTVKYNEPLQVSTKDGNAVVLSEEDYNGLLETLNLCNVSGMREKIMTGLQTPIADCVPEDEVAW